MQNRDSHIVWASCLDTLGSKLVRQELLHVFPLQVRNFLAGRNAPWKMQSCGKIRDPDQIETALSSRGTDLYAIAAFRRLLSHRNIKLLTRTAGSTKGASACESTSLRGHNSLQVSDQLTSNVSPACLANLGGDHVRHLLAELHLLCQDGKVPLAANMSGPSCGVSGNGSSGLGTLEGKIRQAPK